MAVEIHGDEVTRHAGLFIMAHPRIGLDSARPSIAYVVERGVEPAKRRAQQGPEHQHSKHANAQIKQRVRVATWDDEIPRDRTRSRTRPLRALPGGYNRRAPASGLHAHGRVCLALLIDKRIALSPGVVGDIGGTRT